MTLSLTYSEISFQGYNLLPKRECRCLLKSSLTFPSPSLNPLALHLSQREPLDLLLQIALALSLRASSAPRLPLYMFEGRAWLALAGAVTWREMRKGHTGLWQDTAHNERL